MYFVGKATRIPICIFLCMYNSIAIYAQAHGASGGNCLGTYSSFFLADGIVQSLSFT